VEAAEIHTNDMAWRSRSVVQLVGVTTSSTSWVARACVTACVCVWSDVSCSVESIHRCGLASRVGGSTRPCETGAAGSAWSYLAKLPHSRRMTATAAAAPFRHQLRHQSRLTTLAFTFSDFPLPQQQSQKQ